MKHTQGPWKFNINKSALLALNDKNEHVIIYNASPYNYLAPSSANGNLIAAAPEMLEVLILLEKYIKLVGNKVPDTPSALNLCQEVIKKAKGE